MLNKRPFPQEHVEEVAPFFNVGTDLMGSLKIKSGNNIQRVYVVIFACLLIRAIHLETVCDAPATEFLKVLCYFCSIRNCLKYIVTHKV